MNTTATTAARSGQGESAAGASSIARLIEAAIGLLGRIPNTLIAFIARFSIAAVFWNSGQTKVQGFAIDLINGTFELGEPRLAASTRKRPSPQSTRRPEKYK